MLLVLSDWTSCICLPVCLHNHFKILVNGINELIRGQTMQLQLSDFIFHCENHWGVFVLGCFVFLFLFLLQYGARQIHCTRHFKLAFLWTLSYYSDSSTVFQGYLQLQLSSVDQCHGGVAGFSPRSSTTVFNMQWHRLFSFSTLSTDTVIQFLSKIINHIFLFFAHLKAYTISQNIIPKPDLKKQKTTNLTRFNYNNQRLHSYICLLINTCSFSSYIYIIIIYSSKDRITKSTKRKRNNSK